MSFQRTFAIITVSILGTAYFLSNGAEEESLLQTQMKVAPVQYSAVATNYLGVRTVVATGTLEDCVGIQNAARTLNSEGAKIKGVECIPS